MVAGNFIGTNAAATGALGNSQSGVVVANKAQSNRIGTDAIGGTAASGNFIAFNRGAGVVVVDNRTTGNTIRMNHIHDNFGLGIDLNNDGVSLNALVSAAAPTTRRTTPYWRKRSPPPARL